MVCVLVAIALSMLILKGIQFGMSLAHPMPNEELKWKRAPSLPSQSHKSVSSDGGNNSARDSSGKGKKKSNSSGKRRQERQPLAHSEIPLESVSIEESRGISPSSRHDLEITSGHTLV